MDRFTLHANNVVIAGDGARHKGFDNKVTAELAASDYADKHKCNVEVKRESRVVFKALYRRARA